MKFVRFGHGATGLLIGEGRDAKILDVAGSLDVLDAKDPSGASLLRALLPGDGSGNWIALIENWEKARPALETLIKLASSGAAGARTIAAASVRLLPPLADRACRIFALGGNFALHVEAGSRQLGDKNATAAKFISEKSKGLPPWGFIVLPDTVAGQDDEVGPPRDIEKFDYEAEVAIILRRGGKDIRDLQIWGYTAWNDLSIRDPRLGIGPLMDRGAFTWGLEKNFDRGNVCGPCLAVDEPFDINKLKCAMRINGEVRQDFSTSEMMWTFADTAEHISHYITLKVGDVILSGTGPGTAVESGRDGNRWLRPGDSMEIELDGVGVLRNRVIDWSA